MWTRDIDDTLYYDIFSYIFFTYYTDFFHQIFWHFFSFDIISYDCFQPTVIFMKSFHKFDDILFVHNTHP